MSKCENCGRDMNNLNLRFCSIPCRRGVSKDGTPEPQLLYIGKEVNKGLSSPYYLKRPEVEALLEGVE